MHVNTDVVHVTLNEFNIWFSDIVKINVTSEYYNGCPSVYTKRAWLGRAQDIKIVLDPPVYTTLGKCRIYQYVCCETCLIASKSRFKSLSRLWSHFSRISPMKLLFHFDTLLDLTFFLLNRFVCHLNLVFGRFRRLYFDGFWDENVFMVDEIEERNCKKKVNF